MSHQYEATTIHSRPKTAGEVLRSFRNEHRAPLATECSLLEVEVMAGLALRQAIRRVNLNPLKQQPGA